MSVEAAEAQRRLPLAQVVQLGRLLGGDAKQEELVLRFVAAQYGAKSLLYLPAEVAAEICRRPADFIRAARRHREPELGI